MLVDVHKSVLENHTSAPRNGENSLTLLIKRVKLVFDSCSPSHFIFFLSFMVKT